MLSKNSDESAITQRITQSGEQLQGSVRRLFGQQTPEEAQAQQLQEIKTAYTDAVLNVGDPNTPEGLREVARKLNNNPNPNIQMVGVRLNQQAAILEEKRKVANRQATTEELKIKKLEKEIDTMGIPKPNVLPDSEMLIAQGLGIPTNDNFGNPRDITSYTQEESNAIMKKREEQRRSVAKAGSGKFNDITMKEVVDFKKSFGLNFEGDAVSSLESINQIESFLQNAPASGLGGTIIPQLQRAFIKLAEGSSARVSDKDVENILGVENFVDTQVSSLEKFIGGKLSSKKIQSLKELTELYKKQAIKSYNRRVKVAKEDVNRVAFNKNKKDSLINSIPPVEFYLKSPTESIPVGQTRVIEKNIQGVGTVKVRIKGNSNTTTQEEKEEQLGTGTLPSRIPK